MKKTGLLLLLLILLSLCLSGCSVSAVTASDAGQPGTPESPSPGDSSEGGTGTNTGCGAAPREIVISAIGDIMMHNTMITAGLQSAQASYDYSPFFRYVRPLLSASDLVIGNLETTLAGKAAGYSGYPRFNSPEVLAANLKEAGIDVLTTANNHSLDKGYTGLAATLDHLDAAGLLHTGTSRCLAEQETTLLADIKGSKFAILAYTYGTNGLNPPKDRTYAVNYIDEAKMIAAVKKAREAGAHSILVSLHFGAEYQNYPNAEQQALAQSLLDNGADIILGSHPHVLQPASFLDDRFVIYSLGNFISDQTGPERKTGIILNLHFLVDPGGEKPRLEAASYIPIWTHRFRQNGRTQFSVLPVESALTSLQTGQAGALSKTDANQLAQAWRHANKILESDSPRIRLYSLPLPLAALDLIEKLE